MFEVQEKQCETCIYRPECGIDIKKLEARVADKDAPGFFSSYRICHHSNTACCAGFWVRHNNSFSLGQIAQRLNAVEFVSHDTLKRKGKKNGKP